jgi:hypothetical protein
MTLQLWALLGTLATTSSYDLPADIAARSAEAKRELGARTVVQTVESVFVLITPAGQASSSSTAILTKQVLDAYFNGRFDKRPAQAVSVYLFPEAKSYEAYCQQRWSKPCGSGYGFYRSDERRIVMNVGPGIGTLTHELVHPIVEADFPGAPEWLNEGVASLFEALTMPAAGQVHGVKNWRHARLLRALGSAKERDEASLTRLFELDDATFRNHAEDLHYATARYLCQWLDQKGKLWPFYRHFREHRGSDPSGRESFKSIVGKTPAEANTEWAAWVKRL